MKNNINTIARGATLNEIDAIYVLSRKVQCEGPTYSKHPKVLYVIKETEKHEDVLNCSYCNHTFVFKKQNAKK